MEWNKFLITVSFGDDNLEDRPMIGRKLFQGLTKKRRKVLRFIYGDRRRNCDPNEKRSELFFNEQLFPFETRFVV